MSPLPLHETCSQVFTGQYMTSVVLALPLVFYFNHKNKAFWTGMGQVSWEPHCHKWGGPTSFVKDLHQVSVAIAGALPLLAFLAIPPVEQLDQDLPVEETEKEIELCLTDDDDSGDLAMMEESGTSFGASQVAALSLFLLWKLMMGVAITTYWTLGVAYMVDAISPLAVPAALGRVVYFG